MNRVISLTIILVLVLSVVGYAASVESPMTIAEVLEQEDLTFVVAKAVVAGFDAGMKHVILEDPDGGARVQLYKGTGYPFIKIGDEVLVTGYRTFNRSTDHLAPESLEVLSSGHPTSKDNPIVIDYSELNEWTNKNRTNTDILFKWYTFKNVPILSRSTTYTYIDDSYDDEPEGRGLKIGVKDSSFYPPDDLEVGSIYTFTALLYGSSDDFFDETRTGTVLRLSIMSPDDIILHDKK